MLHIIGKVQKLPVSTRGLGLEVEGPERVVALMLLACRLVAEIEVCFRLDTDGSCSQRHVFVEIRFINSLTLPCGLYSVELWHKSSVHINFDH